VLLFCQNHIELPLKDWFGNLQSFFNLSVVKANVIPFSDNTFKFVELDSTAINQKNLIDLLDGFETS
jgi:hypothetical protein